jgi:hypothetical protein
MRRVSQPPTIEAGKLVYTIKPLDARRADFQKSLAASKAYLEEFGQNDSYRTFAGCPRSFFKVIDRSASSTIEDRRREVKMVSAQFRVVAEEVLSRRKARHDDLLNKFNRRNGDMEDESELSESLNWAVTEAISELQ